MWKHREKGFGVYEVSFSDGYAYFRSHGIRTTLSEELFRQVYEYEELK